MISVGERILLTIWIGGMWIVGYVVAPTLFGMIDERALAGNVAGQLFTIINYIGLFSGGLLALSVLGHHGADVVRQWRFWLLLAMLVIIILSEFILQPIMAELKAAGLEGARAEEFGQLHGISSMLYVINTLGGLILVVFGLRPSPRY